MQLFHPITVEYCAQVLIRFDETVASLWLPLYFLSKWGETVDRSDQFCKTASLFPRLGRRVEQWGAVRSSKQQLSVWMLTSPLTGVWSGLGRSAPSRLPLPIVKRTSESLSKLLSPVTLTYTTLLFSLTITISLRWPGASQQSPAIKHTALRCSSENGIPSWRPRTVEAVHNFLPAGVIRLQNDITLPCINQHPAAWEPPWMFYTIPFKVHILYTRRRRTGVGVLFCRQCWSCLTGDGCRGELESGGAEERRSPDPYLGHLG